MNLKNIRFWIVFLTISILVISVFGPEQLAHYKDRATLNQITVEEADNTSAGYRYILSSNEKLYLLSECLNHQTLPESELNAMTKTDVDYEELMGSYAYVVNRQGPSGTEITREEIFDVCNEALDTLKKLGIISESVREVDSAAYTAVLYSAIDVLEPQNNLSVWQINLSSSQQNSDKANRLIDAYIDADTGKMYGFYVRTEGTWASMDPEQMVSDWSQYLGLTGMEAYESENPLLETTSDYKKYRFPGMENRSTIVTIGFYEGINELFLKII